MKFSLFATALISTIFMTSNVQALSLADSELEPRDICTAEIDIALDADKDIGKAVEKLQRAMAARSMTSAAPMSALLGGGYGCCNSAPTLVVPTGCGSCGTCNTCNTCNKCNSCCKEACEEAKKPLGQKVREFYCIQQKLCKGSCDWCKAKTECEKEEKELEEREKKCGAITAKEECTKDTDCSFEGEKCKAKTQKELDKEAEDKAKAAKETK